LNGEQWKRRLNSFSGKDLRRLPFLAVGEGPSIPIFVLGYNASGVKTLVATY